MIIVAIVVGLLVGYATNNVGLGWLVGILIALLA